MKLTHLLLTILLLAALLPASPLTAQAAASPDISLVIAKYRVSLPHLMREKGIPGLAVAVVDDQSVLWAEGFGFTSATSNIPVTADTIFSIQSMSKSFTATATMFAVQEGLVDLNAPVSGYLPGYSVNSLYQENPLEDITLFHLLSHTAGFAHEAPRGGNFTTAPSFDDHIQSIQETWLRFPPGVHYAYSNLGIDLAGYILQQQSGKPYTQYVQETIYDRLGMTRSAFAVPSLRRQKDRATGSTGGIFPPPTDFTILPAGGVYASANDMARYLLFHINKGFLDGQRLLREDLIETMYTPPNLPARLAAYGLGVGVEQINGQRRIGHGGGGFGFLSQMYWYPELKVGVVLLTNSATHDQQIPLTLAILDDVLAAGKDIYARRAQSAVIVPPAVTASDQGDSSGSWLELLRRLAAPVDAPAAERARAIAGEWMLVAYGFPSGSILLTERDGRLFYQNQPLIEMGDPGVYFTPDGERAVFHGSHATITQIPAVKLDPTTRILLTIFYALMALFCLAYLLYPPIKKLAGRRAGRTVPAPETDRQAETRVGRILVAITGLIICGIELGFPNLFFLPWPRAYPEMQWWASLLLQLPYWASAIVLVDILALTLALARGKLEKPLRRYLPAAAFLLVQVIFYLVVIF